MQILTLYLTTSVVFLALDIVMLKRVLYPLFSSNLGDWLLEDPRMGPAAIFYCFMWVVYCSLLRGPRLIPETQHKLYLLGRCLEFWLMELMSSLTLQL